MICGSSLIGLIGCWFEIYILFQHIFLINHIILQIFTKKINYLIKPIWKRGKRNANPKSGKLVIVITSLTEPTRACAPS